MLILYVNNKKKQQTHKYFKQNSLILRRDLLKCVNTLLFNMKF